MASEAQLGLATTRELLDELRVRGMVEMDLPIHGDILETAAIVLLDSLPEEMLNYRSAGD